MVVGAVQSEVRGRRCANRLATWRSSLPLDGAIDVAAVLRAPSAGLPGRRSGLDNPPGSRKPERWQDVEELLRPRHLGVTAINLQYISGAAGRGRSDHRQAGRSSVPESSSTRPTKSTSWMRRRSRDGRRPGCCAELRELALLLAADVVDRQLEDYLDCARHPANWGTQERILVCMTPRSNARAHAGERAAQRRSLPRRAARGLREAAGPERGGPGALDEHLALARELGAEVHCLKGDDSSTTAPRVRARAAHHAALHRPHCNATAVPVEKSDRRRRRHGRPRLSAFGGRS